MLRVLTAWVLKRHPEVLAIYRNLKSRPFSGVEVTPEKQPRLWAEVRRLAEQIQTRPPNRIYVNARGEFFISPRSALSVDGKSHSGKSLSLSLQLLSMISIEHLRGILLHELGHLKHGDLRHHRLLWAIAKYSYKRLSRVFPVVKMARPACQRILLKAFQRIQDLQEERANAVAQREVGALNYLLCQLRVGSYGWISTELLEELKDPKLRFQGTLLEKFRSRAEAVSQITHGDFARGLRESQYYAPRIRRLGYRPEDFPFIRECLEILPLEQSALQLIVGPDKIDLELTFNEMMLHPVEDAGPKGSPLVAISSFATSTPNPPTSPMSLLSRSPRC